MSIQKKIVIGTSLFFLALALYVWLGVFTLIDKIGFLSGEYSNSVKEVKELNKRKSLFEGLQRDYRDHERDLSKIDGVLLKRKETVGLISTFEEIAKESGNELKINKVQPRYPDKKEKQMPYLDLEMTTRGDFNSLLVFFAYLEDSPYPPYRLIELEGLRINKSIQKISPEKEEDKETQKKQLEANMKIKVYIKNNQSG